MCLSIAVGDIDLMINSVIKHGKEGWEVWGGEVIGGYGKVSSAFKWEVLLHMGRGGETGEGREFGLRKRRADKRHTGQEVGGRVGGRKQTV